MRPLRLLVSLSSSLIAIILLPYIAFGSSHEGGLRNDAASPQQKGKLKALFSFTSPSSLFPPSAIISLTDDNSTFFLARPAAFGPELPPGGLSGSLWVGRGFGDDTTGELGCSDVPGWSDGEWVVGSLGLKTASDAKASGPGAFDSHQDGPRTKHPRTDDVAHATTAGQDDGADDYLHQSLADSKVGGGRGPEHTDIQASQGRAEISGKVVLLKRGGCGFLEKVMWAQRRGGVAVIVGDDVRGGGLVRMYAHGDTSDVTIPSLFTSHTTAHLLSSLLPTGGLVQNLSPEDAAKLNLIKSGKKNKNQDKSGKMQEKDVPPTWAQDDEAKSSDAQEKGWLHSLLSKFGLGNSNRTPSKDNNQRPPSSGELDWVLVDKWDEEQMPVGTESATAKATSTPTPADFTIGGQDGRGSALLPERTPERTLVNVPSEQTPASVGKVKEDNVPEPNGWFGRQSDGSHDHTSKIDASPEAHFKHDDNPPEAPKPHEGLWVTLTPTNMSTSPFFDTLLVLVVSPLVTLTVVYALLLLRSRIRRRRWRAPKSLVERLPVRTYHTISDASPSPTPTASSPTTPLLQHPPSRPTSPPSRSPSQPRTEPEVPATSSSFHQAHRTPEEEKRESGLAAWRRRYGGRQKECVVCLEEYEDGISQVMSLPCGHEFHADCITPWLVTRRRTCPICKGDVVRSLSQSYHDRSLSPAQSSRFHDDMDDDFQAQAAETRNDSPSASRPLPIAANPDADMEANWGDEEEGGQEIPRGRTNDLSSSLNQVGSSVATTIWRGFEAVGRATGLQRRSSREEVDRDR